MKVSIIAFGEDTKTAAAPPELFRMKDVLIPQLVVMLRNFGISEAVLTIEPAGYLPVSTVSYKPLMEAQVPQALKTAQADILRGVIKTLMERLGLRKISISLSEAEINELTQFWTYLETGDEQLLDKLQFQNVPLRYETDPTNEIVIEEEHDGKDGKETQESDESKSRRLVFRGPERDEGDVLDVPS